ncbi:MAG: hydrogenase iron-sulfur subunit [Gammaproteobacteria bacterium]|nr:hydrogenase iron-sulfur subunit [Gammaproteobacteria bacterium]
MLSHLSQAALFRIEAWFNSVFGSNNPLYHLGSLGVYFFYIMVVSGIYMFFYYEPTVAGTYNTLQYLTDEQWYLGGVMRSLHRYAADAMVLVMILHILREWVLGRYRGARWFSWVSGVPVLIMVYIIGIEGFWLVWDKLGQFLMVRTAEWLDWLPIFNSTMARNFLSETKLTDMFFRMLIVVHISLPLFLQAFLLLHIKKVSKARILPPRMLALGTLASLLLLALVLPTVSQDRADLSLEVGILQLDWFYTFFYPLMESGSMGIAWVLFVCSMGLLIVLPWLPPKRQLKRAKAVAEVSLDHCNGCGYCAEDCPFEAITMRSRSDGEAHSQMAVVNADNCVACGICIGACPSSMPFQHVQVLKSGIDLPQRNVQHLLEATHEALAPLTGSPRILIYGCDHGVDVERLSQPDTATVSLPCIGALPPAFIHYALRHGADGVLLTACRYGDCYHRLGDVWLRSRLNAKRRPFLRSSVDRSRIGLCGAAAPDQQHLRNALATLRQSLHESPRKHDDFLDV